MFKILTKEQLERLTTKKLLSYRTQLMQLPATPDLNDPGALDKTHPIWQRLYKDVADILNERELHDVAQAIANMENEGGLPSGKK